MRFSTDNYEDMYSQFKWQIPEHYNIGFDACDRWAESDPDRVAIILKTSDSQVSRFSYSNLKAQSDRAASALRAAGIRRGDRVAILMPQRIEAVISHMAIYKLGAIALPLASLFGVDGLQYRLANAGARAIVCDTAGLAKIKQIAGDLPALEIIWCADGADGIAKDFHQQLADANPDFIPVVTNADDPAMMVYTSGTTGQPKGALHAHRVLLGHVPGVEMSHEFFPQPDDLIWTPSDWAWAGGLLNILLAGLRAGVPVLGHAFGKFEPEAAFGLIEEFKVRNMFIAPTALKMMRIVDSPGKRFDLPIRTIMSGGEALGREMFEWGRSELGVTINEIYGQTECNYVLSSCAKIGLSRAGSIGKTVPGHIVAIIDKEGREVKRGELGQIAVKRPDPVMFLEYWDKPDATRDKYVGDWLQTGDQGIMDNDGYVEFVGRDDDVITSAGFRIGPGEIEDCLIAHPAISLAAAVGKPDPMRTEIVKAFVVLNEGFEKTDTLAKELQTYVRVKLSAHEYPREIAFVDEMPLTTTGKVIRRIFRDQVVEEAKAEQQV